MKYLYILFSFLFVQLNAQTPLENTQWKLTSYFYDGEYIEVPNNEEIEEILISFENNTFNTWVCGGLDASYEIQEESDSERVQILGMTEYLVNCSSFNPDFQQLYFNFFFSPEWNNGSFTYEIIDNTLILTNLEGDIATYGIFNMGVIEANQSKEFSIYPNPVEDKLFISGLEGKEYSYDILNVTGQTISSKSKNADKNISVKSLKTGVYILRLTSDKKIQNLKFIKK